MLAAPMTIPTDEERARLRLYNRGLLQMLRDRSFGWVDSSSSPYEQTLTLPPDQYDAIREEQQRVSFWLYCNRPSLSGIRAEMPTNANNAQYPA
jgi:hypothetical protein